MNQETMEKYFKSELGSQCDALFSTPDDRVFIRGVEASQHCVDNKLNPLDIEMWFEEWSGSDSEPKVRSMPYLEDTSSEADYTEDDRQKENEAFMQCCGSCINFDSYMATAGFCRISDNNCICKNPKAMIDMFDEKCDKWALNPEHIGKLI